MTEIDEEEDESLLEAMDPIYLQEETCWVADADLLVHDSGAEGVLAVQYKGGQLWYLDGESRKWLNAEADSKPQRGLRPVN